MGYFETFGSEHEVLTAVGCEESFVSEWGEPPLESFGHSLRLLGFAFQFNIYDIGPEYFIFQLNPWREIEKFYFPIQ